MRIDFQNAILLVLCLVLLLSVFSMSALAVSTDSEALLDTSVSSSVEDHSTSQNIRSASPSAAGFYPLPTSDITLASISGNTWYGYALEGEIYACWIYSGPGGNNYMGPLFLSKSSGRVQVRRNGFNSTDTLSYYSTYDIYQVFSLAIGYSSSDLVTVLPVYSDWDSAVQAFASYDPNPAPQGSFTYSLPPGNAIYIQVPQGASYTLKTRMPESVLGSNHYPGNNQAITLVQSLPSGGSAPTSPLIPWLQDGALSVLGLSRNAIYQGTNASAGYLCIVNPLYYSGTANGPYEFLSNGSIDISVDTQTGFVVYPLDSSLGFTSGLGINVDTTILDNPYTGEIDPDTGEITWQDSNGGTTAPTTGGGNLVSTSETIFDFLRNIGDEISTFLKGPIQAIQVVVSAIRDFLSSFTQLYMWLPSPVYNLITSALMIALTIGVIKIFV